MNNKINIVLYSTDCPKCKVLKKKLDAANINYSIIDDTEIMSNIGITKVPVLQIAPNDFLDFAEAAAWINNCNR